MMDAAAREFGRLTWLLLITFLGPPHAGTVRAPVPAFATEEACEDMRNMMVRALGPAAHQEFMCDAVDEVAERGR